MITVLLKYFIGVFGLILITGASICILAIVFTNAIKVVRVLFHTVTLKFHLVSF